MAESNLIYKTGQRRFWAALVDSLVFVPIMFADNFVRTSCDNTLLLFFWFTLITVFSIAYSVLLHHKFGQTIGKWAVNIKVVNLDESQNLTLKQAVMRDIFYVILQPLALLYLLFQLFQTSLTTEEVLNNYDNFGFTVMLVWVSLELISMLTNDKRRAIHDFIAGSVVIRTDIEKE